MIADLDHAVRSALGDIVAAAPHPDDQPMRLVTVETDEPTRRPFLAVAASLALLGGVGTLYAISTSDSTPTSPASAPIATDDSSSGTVAATVVTDPPSSSTVDTTSSSPTSDVPVEVRLRLDGIGPYAFGEPQSLVEATLTQSFGQPVVMAGAPVVSCLQWGCADSAVLSWPTAGLFVAFSDRTVDGVALAEPVLAAWTITTAATWWPGDVHRPDPTSRDVAMPAVPLALDNGVQLGSTFAELQSALPSAVGTAWNASTFMPTGFFVPGADATTAIDGTLDWNVVADLQSALVDEGASLEVDGVAGPATTTAFAAYRERTGLDPQAAFAALGVQPPADAKVVRLSAGDWFWELGCGSLEPFGIPSGC